MHVQYAFWDFRFNGLVPEQIHTLPTEEISAVRRGGGRKFFLIIHSVLGHPKGVGGLTSNFLRGGGMDVFWNDPIHCFWSQN